MDAAITARKTFFTIYLQKVAAVELRNASQGADQPERGKTRRISRALGVPPGPTHGRWS
jgi:hypothetical protein